MADLSSAGIEELLATTATEVVSIIASISKASQGAGAPVWGTGVARGVASYTFSVSGLGAPSRVKACACHLDIRSLCERGSEFSLAFRRGGWATILARRGSGLGTNKSATESTGVAGGGLGAGRAGRSLQRLCFGEPPAVSLVGLRMRSAHYGPSVQGTLRNAGKRSEAMGNGCAALEILAAGIEVDVNSPRLLTVMQALATKIIGSGYGIV
ncbi:hypothetical protein B0T16DRAFT_498953 [Cercophora newfieldiana]|uniref:Uncharacterized protein n=1 Tax=Cercophora newfieldiana TaxID=92897 RepID=A0AA39YNW4_9PEZI|nr:hypothetical protein B0T16DRAFT_498953 [Cercophora newfieldiana]